MTYSHLDPAMQNRKRKSIPTSVSHNSVSVNDLPSLIQSVHTSLARLGEAPAPVEEKRQPAVLVRSSVKPDSIACLECGGKFKMLKRHLSADHNLTREAYRARWDLPSGYPMVAPDYAAKRRELAVRIGLGRKAAATPATAPAPVKPAAPRRKKLVATSE